MKILYFTNVNKDVPTEAGVLKKINAQIKVLNSKGNKLFLAAPNNSEQYSIGSERGNVLISFSTRNTKGCRKLGQIIKHTKEFIIGNDIKAVYVRHGTYSFQMLFFYRWLKKHGIKIILELPTYPLSQRWTSIKQCFHQGRLRQTIKKLIVLLDSSTGIPFLHFYIDRIVNNNGYSIIWKIPVIPITNGIDVQSVPKRHHHYLPQKEIRIMTVANVAHWHGLDRLIDGMADYYKTKPQREVYFDIAGPGQEIVFLKRQVVELKLDKYVNFYGITVGKRLEELFETADIGVSVLGVHRNKMSVIDSLKSREFCARQLPFITETTEVHMQKKRFTLCFPSDESPIDINKILVFYDKIVSDNSILSEMYSFAQNECSWDFAFKNVVDYFNKVNVNCK